MPRSGCIGSRLSVPAAQKAQDIMLVTCPCEECGAHLEFDPAELEGNEAVVQCPNCNKETRVYVPRPPPPLPRREPSSVAQPAIKASMPDGSCPVAKGRSDSMISGVIAGIVFLLVAAFFGFDGFQGTAADLVGHDETVFQQIFRSLNLLYHLAEMSISIISAGIAFALMFLGVIASKL